MASRWLERLYRGNKLAVISGALLLTAFLILNAFFLGHRSTADASGPLPASPQQPQHPGPQPSHLRTTSHELESYCSPEFTSSAVREGSGVDPMMRLTNVLLLTRHGDRTPIHTVDNSVFAPHKEYYAPSAFQYKHNLAKFRLSALGDTQKEEPLHDALDPHAVFTTPDHKLAPGTLTSWGFMQHVELGKALAKAYQKFIMALDIQKDIYIRSTHYERTIQSAAGLMIGLLGNDLAAVKTRLPIQVFLWDSMEFMHGSGLRDTSKAKDESTRWIEGSCTKAVEYSAKQHEAIQPRKAVMEQLASLFGEGVRSMKVTELTDAIMPAYCHGEPLPCSQNGCMNIELLKEMKRDSDRVYCKRYWGAEGGLNATKLSHYQLMSEVATRVRESATGKSHIKFSLLSGHDTVIAPVLASLGVPSCGWPPYASRLTFETWTTAREGAPTKLENTYARVLYNGKVVTTSIPGCVAASNRDTKISNMRSKSQLCPLPILLNHISGLLQPYPDLHTACTST